MKIPDGTLFQQKVWQELMKIPYGKTKTYKEIAISIGHPRSYRAVGAACKNNPFPVVIPCHRVVRSDGAIGGYSRGKRLKKQLLDIEKTMNL